MLEPLSLTLELLSPLCPQTPASRSILIQGWAVEGGVACGSRVLDLALRTLHELRRLMPSILFSCRG